MARVDEWVEAAGSTVDLAVEAALRELGIASRDEATIEVIQEPSKGILGTAWRAQDAVVKVTPKPKEPKKKRRRRSRKKPSEGEGGGEPSEQGGGERGRRGEKPAGGGGKQRSSAGRNQQSGPRQGGKGSAGSQRPTSSSSKPSGGSPEQGRSAPKQEAGDGETQEATIEEQATVAASFITGLLEAFGLEGTVETEIDDDILKINVTGDQTEALVGRKGAIMQSVHEITRTVVQRKTFGAPRMRLDINGYGERRREALKIYTVRQAERVLADGGEIMLEPMNPADRKVVHDAVGEIDGVESYSEGVEPHRAVVIAPVGNGD